MVTYILRSRSPRFHGPVILPYILNTICWINVTPGILLPCDPMNDHLLLLYNRVFTCFKQHVYYVSINSFIYNVSKNNFLECSTCLQ